MPGTGRGVDAKGVRVVAAVGRAAGAQRAAIAMEAGQVFKLARGQRVERGAVTVASAGVAQTTSLVRSGSENLPLSHHDAKARTERQLTEWLGLCPA